MLQVRFARMLVPAIVAGLLALPSAVSAEPAVGDPVRVNQDAELPRSHRSLDAARSGLDPDRLFVVSQDAADRSCWLHRSTDGGATWSSTEVDPPIQFARCGTESSAPGIALALGPPTKTLADGSQVETVYVVYAASGEGQPGVARTGIFVDESADGGRETTTIGVAHLMDRCPCPTLQAPRVALDPAPDADELDAMVVTWTEGVGTGAISTAVGTPPGSVPGTVYAAVSKEHLTPEGFQPPGHFFGRPQVASPGSSTAYGFGVVAVGQRYLVLYEDLASGCLAGCPVLVSRLELSQEPVGNLSLLVFAPRLVGIGEWGGSMARGADGTVYVATTEPTSHGAEVVVHGSDDEGSTWTSTRASEPGPWDRFVPRVAVAPDGRIDVAFSRTFGEAAGLASEWEVVHTSSQDGGETWSADVPVDRVDAAGVADLRWSGPALAPAGTVGFPVWLEAEAQEDGEPVVDVYAASLEGL